MVAVMDGFLRICEVGFARWCGGYGMRFASV